MDIPHRYSPNLDPEIEGEVRAMLVEYYAPIYKERVDSFVDTSLATEHFAQRFLYLRSVIGEEIFKSDASILISGFGMGSEMIMSRQFGFGKIYGVEVEQILVDVTKKRLRDFSDTYPAFYDGRHLPYEDGQFHVAASGHVIEHTGDPGFYLQEVLRVLAPGGYLSLEFPHRYYYLELHTRLPSLEWMPKSLRNLALRVVSSKISPLNQNVKSRYYSIYSTNLQQISMGGVMRMLQKTGFATKLVNKQLAAPGIIHCVIQRN